MHFDLNWKTNFAALHPFAAAATAGEKASWHNVVHPEPTVAMSPEPYHRRHHKCIAPLCGTATFVELLWLVFLPLRDDSLLAGGGSKWPGSCHTEQLRLVFCR